MFASLGHTIKVTIEWFGLLLLFSLGLLLPIGVLAWAAVVGMCIDHLVALPVWSIITSVTVMWYCRYALSQLPHWRPTVSLRTLLLIIAWCGVGSLCYISSRTAMAEKSVAHELATIKGSGTAGDHLRRAYELGLTLSDMSPEVRQYRQRVGNHHGYGHGADCVRIQFFQLCLAMQIDYDRIANLPLQSAPAQKIRQEFSSRMSSLGHLARQTSEAIDRAALTEKGSIEKWQIRLTDVRHAGREIKHTVEAIELSRNGIVATDPRSLSELLRPAAFDALMWPGLTDKQLADIQATVDSKPLVARILLVEYACTNAQKKLASEGLLNTEKDVLEALKKRPTIACLLP
jgi:hypothetical protein